MGVWREHDIPRLGDVYGLQFLADTFGPGGMAMDKYGHIGTKRQGQRFELGTTTAQTP